MRYYDFVDWLFFLFIGTLVLVLAGLVTFAVADGLTHESGVVVNKYYDDPDLVCSKGCVVTSECWTIVLDGTKWYNDSACVSESTFYTIDLGDTFKE